MRILLITSRYLPHTGGLEVVVHELAAHLRLGGHKVQIVAQRVPRTLPSHEQIDQTQVIRLLFIYPDLGTLMSGRLGLWLAAIVYLPLTLIKLYGAAQRFKPDVINFHYVGIPALFVWLLSYLYRVPLIVSLHGGDVNSIPFENRFRCWLFKAILRRASEVTACSKVLLTQALELSPDSASKAHVITNGVDTALFASIAPHDHLRPYIFAVGQLGQHKGFDILLGAFAEIARAYPEIDLLIAGEGREKDVLDAQIQSNGLAGRAVLLGRVSHDQVAAFMKGSLVIVIPSRREPFGIVGLEAMASGRPVIVRRVGGLVEALEEATVTWLEDENPTSLAEALRQVLDRPDRAQPSETNQQKAECHSWGHVTEQYLTLYQSHVAEDH